MLDEQGPDHLCRGWRAVGQVAPLHGSEEVILAPEVLKVAGFHLLQDAHLHKVRHTILPIGDHADRCTPLLGRLRLLWLLWLLRLLRLLLLRLSQQDLEVGQLLPHLVVDKGPELSLDYREDRLPRQLDVVTLVEVVALVAALPHLCILVDLLHKLLHHTRGPHFVGLVLSPIIGALALLPILALFRLVILGLGVLAALGLTILPLLPTLVVLRVFVEALVELVEVVGKLELLVRLLEILQDPLPPILEEIRLDVRPLLSLQPLELLFQGLLEDIVGIFLHLLPPFPLLLYLCSDLGLCVVRRRRHAQELKLLLAHLQEPSAVDLPLPMRSNACGGQDLALEHVIPLVTLLGLPFQPLLFALGLLSPRANHVRPVDTDAPSLVLLDDGYGLVRGQADLEGILLVDERVHILRHAEDAEPMIDLVLLVLYLLSALLVVQEISRNLPLYGLRIEFQVGQDLVKRHEAVPLARVELDELLLQLQNADDSAL
mmetsp:Transcript_88275/g.189508  ORF Transcript_88275/g.189508 Transcript_88275/m.189508 type:complete len:488 (-) Transcript_88275:388-1851(-)